MPTALPYGSWPSPISAAEIARGGVRIGGAALIGDEVWWAESRPEEAGRQLVRRRVNGQVHDLLAPPWNVRTRVHEYGGASWTPVPAGGDHALVFAHFGDQRLYRVDGGGDPQPITPEPPEPSGWRYAEPTVVRGGSEIWCIREGHAAGTVTRNLVAVPLDGGAADDPAAVRVLAGGSDFLAFPTISPDGRHVAWIGWNHPDMPWDSTTLHVAAVAEDGTVGDERTVAGGRGEPGESVLQPTWIDATQLLLVSDRSGWWNLYRVRLDGGDMDAVCPGEQEFGGPLWTLGQSYYTPLADGRIAVLHGTDELRLGVVDPTAGTLTDVEVPYTEWAPSLSGDGTRVIGVGAAADRAPELVVVDVASGAAEVVRRSVDSPPDARFLPPVRAITVDGPGGRDVHALVYPPTNPDAVAPEGERPPYVAFVHGGPTSQVGAALDLSKAYFTSRGIGVVDVNYGGSTGYGRAYRDRLRGQWGIVDVEDVVAAVRALVAAGQADPARLAIRGGSAGGWTTLAALTTTDVFAAGTSLFGVAELLEFTKDTHDFESRYIDGLVGPLPEAHDLYVQRAPLSHVDDVSCPVLLLQGADDKVVPPSQAEMFRDALVRKQIPHAYLLFDGEQHGFRQAPNIIAALEAELSFYGQIFGFDPPGVPELKLWRSAAG
ncbi:MAG: S9 family peptidase [Mycobacteriales bacterium]|nr:MAG: S9 family peptidase [Pseudonocardiales bacterium]